MTYKPMKLWDYLSWIGRYGWKLSKGSIDWKLYDENDIFLCSIKLQHPGNREIVAESVDKTRKQLKKRGYKL